MKKLMFTAAVAAAMGAFAIESANTVGYTTKTIPAGKYMMIAVQFDKVGGTAMTPDEAFELNAEAKTVAAWENDVEVAGWTANAPCLKIPNGTVDKLYRDLYYTCNAWDDDLGYVPGWADADGFLVKDATMLNGYGVWLVAGSAPLTVTIKGEVKGASSDTITAGAGYNMLKLPYPVALNASDAKINWNLTSQAVPAWENDVEVAGWTANAPALKIPNGTVDMLYRDLFYTSNAWDDDLGYVEGWADADGFLVKDALIPEGQAFWLVVPAAVTATVTK